MWLLATVASCVCELDATNLGHEKQVALKCQVEAGSHVVVGSSGTDLGK